MVNILFGINDKTPLQKMIKNIINIFLNLSVPTLVIVGIVSLALSCLFGLSAPDDQFFVTYNGYLCLLFTWVFSACIIVLGRR